MKKLKSIDKNYLIILGIAIFIFAPYISSVLARGDDYLYHLANIEAITKSFKNGILYPRILPLMARNLGYGSALFYPPLSHHIGAFFYLILGSIGFSLNTCFKATLLLGYLLAGIFFYQTARRIIKDNTGSIIATITYMCLPYFLTDIFHRASLAEVYVFVFIPLVIRAMYELLQNNHRKFSIYFIIGFTGLIFSHLIVSVYFAILCIVFLLVNVKHILNKKAIKTLIISSITIISITSIYTFPMLEQKFSANYVVFSEGAMATASSIYNRAMNVGDYFYETGNQDIRTYFSTISIILLIFVLIERKKLLKEMNNQDKQFWNGIIIFTGVSLLLSSKIIPWRLLPSFFYNLQFPWRLNSFSGLGIALILGLSPKLFKDDKIEKLLLIVFLTLSLTEAKNAIYTEPFTHKELNMKELHKFNSSLGYQHEYLTINGNKKERYLKKRNQDIITDNENTTIDIIKNNTPNLEFNIKTNGETTIEIPRLYYKGYKIELIENNKKENIKYKENKNGLISFKVNKSGKVKITYSRTPIEKISIILSITSILTTIILFKKKKEF